MTIVDYYNRVRKCKADEAGEPCEHCTAMRALLGTVAPHIGHLEQLNASTLSEDPNAGDKEIGALITHAEASICVAYMLFQFSATIVRPDGQLEFGERIATSGFAMALTKAMSRYGIIAGVAVPSPPPANTIDAATLAAGKLVKES